jgi:hypothetical protein
MPPSRLERGGGRLLLKGGGIVGFTSTVDLTEGATPRNGMKSTTYSKAVSPYLTSSAHSLIPTVLLPDCFNASGTHLPAESCS